MFYRIIGPMGSGKKEEILSLAKKAFSQGERVFVLVPEQVTAEYEAYLTRHLGDSCCTLVEVCNFSRLPDVVLRNYGSLYPKSATEEEKKMLLALILKENKGSFRHLPSRFDPDSVDSFYGELEEMRLAGLDAEAIGNLVSEEGISPDLSEKLQEVLWLQNAFRTAVESCFADPRGEEMRLAEILESYPFFQDATVLIDGFWDFTAPQEALIRRFLRQAKTVAVTFVAKKGEEELFEKPLRSARRLLRFARQLQVSVEDVKKEELSSGNSLSYLREHLVNLGEGYESEPQQLSLTSCQTPSDEAAFVADTILRMVHEGADWKDFAILSRTQNEEELVRLTLESEGIPTFSEAREDLAASPAAATLLLATRIASLYAKEETVREYLNQGLFVCDETERFLLEKYVATWSLSGRAVLTGEDFTMNPDGYMKINDSQEKELRSVNRAARMVFDPLRRLSFHLAGGKNAEKIEALVQFLQEIGTQKILFEKIRQDEEAGLFENAGKKVRHWNCVLERLSGIGRIAGEKEDSAEDFYRLLTLAFSGAAPGSMPSGQDRVHMGKLGFARPVEAKYIFLLGLQAGSFPAVPPKGRLFSERDRAGLEERGYLLLHGDSFQNEELFLFYLAAAMAKEHLFLSYVKGDAGGEKGALSVFGKRVKTLFPKLKETSFSASDMEIRTCESAFRYVLAHGGESGEKEAFLESYLGEKEEYRARLLTALSGKAYEGDGAFLKEEKPYAQMDISMTYSRLESYSRCRYSYFARYLLEAKQQGKARFGANITGSLVHRVLELVLVSMRAENKHFSQIEKGELKERCEAAFREAMNEVLGETKPDGALEIRLRSLFRSTLLILENLQKEFSVSSFEPIYFEKELTDLGGSYKIPLSDGKNLCLYGTIDRVDRYTAQNGREYIRVVDYKTGSQSFRLEDVANGLDLQMLLYLFALWGRPLEEGGQGALPAGILYMSGMGTAVPCENREDVQKVEEKPFFGMEREGLLVNDPELLSAQDPDGMGEWIPVAYNRKNSSKKALVSLENLGKLRAKVEADFARLAEELKDGRIETNPLYSQSKKIDPCLYCDHLAICKRSPESRRAYRVGADKELFGKEEA